MNAVGIKLFEDKGWKVNFRYKDVVAVNPSGKDYTICQKYYGGTDYDKEITAAYNKAVEKGLIKV